MRERSRLTLRRNAEAEINVKEPTLQKGKLRPRRLPGQPGTGQGRSPVLPALRVTLCFKPTGVPTEACSF